MSERPGDDRPYAEWPSAIRGATSWVASATSEPTRVLPDGCMDLLWMDGRAWVAGPDTHAALISRPAGAPIAGLRFAPGHGPRAVGVPARELRDLRVPLDQVWEAREVRRLTDALAAGDRPTEVLEAEARRRILAGTAAARDEVLAVDDLVAALRRGTSVSELAAAAGWSARHLRRRCDDAFGYGPKLLARILRLQRSLALARRGVRFADVAARTGYSDQAHLARDVRALAGVPLGQLVS